MTNRTKNPQPLAVRQPHLSTEPVKPGLPCLFLVWVTQGAYDSRDDTVIAAYLDEAEAERHVERGKAIAAKLLEEHGDFIDAPASAHRVVDMESYSWTWSDLAFYVTAIPLCSSVDAYPEEWKVWQDRMREVGAWGTNWPTVANPPECYVHLPTRLNFSKGLDAHGEPLRFVDDADTTP